MSGNIPRQAPSPSQASHPVNGGIGGNGMPLANGLPSGGQTTDMNYLWNVIQTLCDTLAENRAQASNLVNGVAQIQARAAQEGSSPTIAQVNGELSGKANHAYLWLINCWLTHPFQPPVLPRSQPFKRKSALPTGISPL